MQIRDNTEVDIGKQISALQRVPYKMSTRHWLTIVEYMANLI